MRFTNQQLKALDLNRNIIVTAGAGSGKTTVLVERYVRILLERGVEPAHILAITFTEKAAAEMKNRVVERLKKELDNPAYRERAFRLLAMTPEMNISTIHAFCHRLLRNYANSVGLDPEFDVADDLNVAEIRETVFAQFFNQDELPFAPEVLPLVEQAIEYFSLRAVQALFEWAHDHRLQLEPHLQRLIRETPDTLLRRWADFKHQRLEEFVRQLLVHPAIQALKRVPMPEGKAKYLQALRQFLQVLQGTEAPDTGEIFTAFLPLITQSLTVTHHLKNYLIRQGIWDDKLADALNQFLTVMNARMPLHFNDTDKAALEQFAAVQIGMAHLLTALLRDTESEKRRRQLVDFSDLLALTRQLLREAPAVRRELQHQYRWLLVDEFQDTDRVQAEIIDLLHQPLSEDTPAPNLFLVGDPKQSIYGFRDADVRIFREFEEKVQQRNANTDPFTDADGNPLPASESEQRGRITLPHNFRSLSTLVEFFNHSFEPIFDPISDYDVTFVPLEAGRTDDQPAQIAIHHLIHQEESDPDPDILYHHTLPKLIHQIVQEHGYTFGDIAILLQTRNALTGLEEALQRANIPYEVYKGIGFFQRQEILDVYHLLRAVENPRNNMALWAALRTPYAGVSDAVLYVLGQMRSATVLERIRQLVTAIDKKDWSTLPVPPGLTREHIQTIVEPEGDALKYFYQQITELSARQNTHHFSELLNEILLRFGVKAALHHTFRGDQKLANIDKLIQYVYDIQRRPGSSLTELLRILDRQIRRVDREGEAVISAMGGNRVQIMTIHAAKGLEFPVVILPNLTQGMVNRETVWVADEGLLFKPGSERTEKKFFITRWFETQNRLKLEAEHKRLFYVAATRARDHLYLLSIAGTKMPSVSFHTLLWEKALNVQEVHPEAQLPRWIQQLPNTTVTVEDYHTDEWEPYRLPETASGPQPQIEMTPEAGARYWQVLDAPPQQVVYSATQLMLFQENRDFFFQQFFLNRYQLFPPMIALDDVEEADPAGIGWGILVHRVLENFHTRSADDDAPVIERVLQEIPVQSDHIDAYREQLTALLQRFREHPVVTEIQASPHALAEYTLRAPMDDTHWLLGKLDYLFQRPDGTWAVVDFKTNRTDRKGLDSLVQKYAMQMETYALLVHHLFPEQPTIPVGLFFLQPMEVRWRHFTPDALENTRNTVLDLMHQLDQFLRELLIRGG